MWCCNRTASSCALSPVDSILLYSFGRRFLNTNSFSMSIIFNFRTIDASLLEYPVQMGWDLPELLRRRHLRPVSKLVVARPRFDLPHALRGFLLPSVVRRTKKQAAQERKQHRVSFKLPLAFQQPLEMLYSLGKDKAYSVGARPVGAGIGVVGPDRGELWVAAEGVGLDAWRCARETGNLGTRAGEEIECKLELELVENVVESRCRETISGL